MKKKIAVVLVNRANYARMKPVMQALQQEPDVDMQTICAGSMLLDRYGSARTVVAADGYPVDAAFFMTNVMDDTHVQAVLPLYTQLGFTALVYNEPRMFGFSLKYRFGGDSEPESTPAAYTPPPVVRTSLKTRQRPMCRRRSSPRRRPPRRAIWCSSTSTSRT